jgi:hypothetical protein
MWFRTREFQGGTHTYSTGVLKVEGFGSSRFLMGELMFFETIMYSTREFFGTR